jgi:hypothetical protein
MISTTCPGTPESIRELFVAASMPAVQETPVSSHEPGAGHDNPDHASSAS